MALLCREHHQAEKLSETDDGVRVVCARSFSERSQVVLDVLTSVLLVRPVYLACNFECRVPAEPHDLVPRSR
jgi:hypothetical protein